MKFKYLTLDARVLLAIFTGETKAEVIENVIPKDSRVVSMGHNQFGQIHLVIESDSFPELNQGEEIPSLPHPIFRKVE